MTVPAMGRRERKNAQTRKSLADAARRLFLENGYDQVSVKEIADAVDISVPTVFKHVPDGKEALMFDDGVERMPSVRRVSVAGLVGDLVRDLDDVLAN